MKWSKDTMKQVEDQSIYVSDGADIDPNSMLPPSITDVVDGKTVAVVLTVLDTDLKPEDVPGFMRSGTFSHDTITLSLEVSRNTFLEFAKRLTVAEIRMDSLSLFVDGEKQEPFIANSDYRIKSVTATELRKRKTVLEVVLVRYS